MLSFFRRVIDKQVAKSETRILRRRIDESEVCVVSVESLRCSICYSIYAGTPLMLQCGHSFCAACVERLIDNNQGNQAVPCPMCRKSVNLESASKNYVLKSILDTVDEISKEEERAGRAYSNTMEVTNEVLRQQLAEAEKSVDWLENTVIKDYRNDLRDLFIIIFVGFLYISYFKFF